jgi:hypothetical protein
MDAAVSRGQDGPSYGLALVAVLAAGAVASAVSFLFIGLFAVGGMPVRYLVGALISALVVQVILRVLGFEISYGGAVAAMFAGAVAAVALRMASALDGTAGAGAVPWVAQRPAEPAPDRLARAARRRAPASRASGLGRARGYAPWHFLNFLPEPHQQGSLRPSFSRSGVTR